MKTCLTNPSSAVQRKLRLGAAPMRVVIASATMATHSYSNRGFEPSELGSFKRSSAHAPLRRTLVLTAPLWALAGCAGLMGPPVLKVTPQELQQKLAKRFPMRQKVLDLMEVELAVPEVTLLPSQGRVAMRLPVRAGDPQRGSVSNRLEAWLGFNARPVWRANVKGVTLEDVQVTEFSLANSGRSLPFWLQGLGGSLAAQALEGGVVWQATDDQLAKLKRLGWQPAEVKVLADGLELALVAAA